MGTVNDALNVPNLSVKSTPVSADYIVIADSAANNDLKLAEISTLPTSGSGISDAIYPTPISGYNYPCGAPSPMACIGPGSAFGVIKGNLYLFPFYNAIAHNYTGISVISSQGLGSVGMAVYGTNTANNAPTGNPLTNSATGTVTLASGSNTFNFSSPISLSSGIYWLAFACNAFVSVNITGTTANEASFNANTINTTNILCCSYYIQAFTYSATFPTIGTLVATDGTGGMGALFLVAQ